MAAENDIRVRRLEEGDLPEATRILRLAFGTFLGVADPTAMFPGRDIVASRWRADPEAAFAAEHKGRLIATNFAANWGSFGFFGPITVHPEYWGQRISQALLNPTMALFDRWGIEHRGLFTFPHSPKHIHLYEKYGFQAGHLTAVFHKKVSDPPTGSYQRLSHLSTPEQNTTITECRSLTGRVLKGLDLTREIAAILTQRLGEVCLIYDPERRLSGFALCHCGRDTEAGDGICYVKFGVVDPAVLNAAEEFSRLLAACESLAYEARLEQISLGINMGRRKAYALASRFGYRTEFIGVAMETHPERSYNRSGIYLIDDWR